MTATTAPHRPRTVVFDIGNVLVQWDPRHLYRGVFDGDEALMEHFLANVCTPAWNLEQDRGRPWDEAVRLLTAEFPDCAELIRAYHERWMEMVPDAVAGTPDILLELKDRGTPLYAITNFSVEKFALTTARFDFLNVFDGIVVSGDVRLVKPDAAIYHALFDGYGLAPADCLFIDDSAANVEAARAVGMTAHHFTDAERLRADLVGLGLLD